MTDVAGAPVAGAKIALYQWSGRWKALGLKGVTAMNGEAAIALVPFNAHLAIVVHADGFAPKVSEVNTSDSAVMKVELTLDAPAQGFFDVVSPDGAPVAGAKVQKIAYSSAGGKEVYLAEPELKLMQGGVLPESDMHGHLKLPVLPRDVSATIWIGHQNWRVAVIKKVRVASGLLERVKLVPGVPIEIRLHPFSESSAPPIGNLATVSLYPTAKDDFDQESMSSTLSLHDGTIRFTAGAISYSELKVKVENHFVTPHLLNIAPDRLNAALDFTDASARVIRMNLHRKVTASGKIVDESGTPIAGAVAWGLIENLLGDWKDTGVRTPKDQQWFAASEATTDTDGHYSIDLCPGVACVDVYKDGYFASPDFVKFEVPAVGPAQIPKIRLKRTPTLKGTVLTNDGKAAPGAFVRMRSMGFGDADPVGLTNSDGQFELPVRRLPYRRDRNGLEKDAYVISFDPKLGLAGRAPVELTNSDVNSNIELRLNRDNPEWVLNPLEDLRPDSVSSELNTSINRLQQRFSPGNAGKLGTLFPDLSQGAWINADGRSLKDYSGKVILIDFWFIGCGPCHREFDGLNAIQSAFKESRFTVISIHDNSQSPDDVRKFVQANGIEYPVVVDDSAGSIMKQCKQLGINSFPSYILVGPQRQVLMNDADTSSGLPSLRENKAEIIFNVLMAYFGNTRAK